MADDLNRLRAALADRYEVERELGSGGMATVYLARDRRHHRQVAIKVLRPELAAVLGAERFLREIQIAANLQHSHVLPLYDSGEADGLLYYVMPFVKGESLRSRLAREGELPIAEAVRYLRDVSDALAYAHREGIVHRDIKPDNVMLAENHAMVTDFGVAKALSEASDAQHMTSTGMAIGTPAYMSPEQAAADSTIDHRADLYSFGAMAYEMLTGRPPFQAPTVPAVLAAHLTDAPEPVTARRESVPPPLADLVMRCLAKKPADRWQSAEDLLHTLEVLATPSGGTEPVRTVAKPRRWRGALFAGGSLLAVVVAFLGVTLLGGRSNVSEQTLAGIQAAASAGRMNDVYADLTTAGLTLDDSRLSSLVDEISGTVSVETDPSDVAVAAWRVGPIETFRSHPEIALGTTPVAARRLVAGEYVLRLMPQARDTVTLLAQVDVGADLHVRRTLLPADAGWRGMVLVDRGASPLQPNGPAVPAFLIDRTEVRNAEFARFVDAGGYRDSTFWPPTLLIDGHRTPWAVAVRTFVDRSGLPGPRDWTSGTFPSGRDDSPVTGVTWYEASAFARWVGKELPSRVQWYRAALGDTAHVYPWGRDARTVSRRANFSLEGATPVGSFPLGVSPFGCFDMAGNVREWLRGEDAETGEFEVAGGSWQDPTYMFFSDHVESFDPGFAGPGLGFRLVTRVPTGR